MPIEIKIVNFLKKRGTKRYIVFLFVPLMFASGILLRNAGVIFAAVFLSALAFFYLDNY